jgi:hypothetical protein
MNSSIKFLVLCSTIIFLTACTKVQSIDYYKNHIDEAKQVAHDCNAKLSKGDSLNDKEKQNCTNAATAEVQQITNVDSLFK